MWQLCLLIYYKNQTHISRIADDPGEKLEASFWVVTVMSES